MSNLLRVIDDPNEMDYFKYGLRDRDISNICKGQIGKEFIEYEKLIRNISHSHHKGRDIGLLTVQEKYQKWYL